MGSIGPVEILVVLVVALLVLGPQRLPDAARSLGRAIGEVRRYTAGFQDEMRDAFAEPPPATPSPPATSSETPPVSDVPSFSETAPVSEGAPVSEAAPGVEPATVADASPSTPPLGATDNGDTPSS